MRILVTDGNNRAALAVTRALGTEGHAVVVAERRSPALAQMSRYCAAPATYPDPTADSGEDWSVVDVAPVKPLVAPVTLAAIKADEALADIQLLRRSRLSVVPISEQHFRHILKLGKTKL